MNQEKMKVDRVLAAVAQRPSTDTARMVGEFFVSCLKQRNHPHIHQIEQELVVLMPLIDYLLIMHAVEGGFFRLETGDMEITLRASYDVPVTTEDLSVPSLGVMGNISEESPITLIINRNQDVPVDKNLLAIVDKVNDRKILNIRVEAIAKGEAKRDLVQKEPVPQLKAVIEALHLPSDLLEKDVQELVDSTSLWRAEEALVAHTIAIRNLRVIVGELELGRSVEVDKITFHIERVGTKEYKLGVFLIPPFTKRERWEQDRTPYRDFIIGDVPQAQLEEAIHLLLT